MQQSLKYDAGKWISIMNLSSTYDATIDTGRGCLHFFTYCWLYYLQNGS